MPDRQHHHHADQQHHVHFDTSEAVTFAEQEAELLHGFVASAVSRAQRVAAAAGLDVQRILDVGCGEGPYEELLAPLARSGRIRYTGIEPDAKRVARLRERWPWAQLEVATAESFVADGTGRKFDHVLVLRSWNHLSDPASAARGLVAALKPGGSLLVVDNAAFGLARTPAQTRRGQSSPAAFEHYRNDTAEDAERILRGCGLELVERREVGPETSNQWLLRYVARL